MSYLPLIFFCHGELWERSQQIRCEAYERSGCDLIKIIIAISKKMVEIGQIA